MRQLTNYSVHTSNNVIIRHSLPSSSTSLTGKNIIAWAAIGDFPYAFLARYPFSLKV
jgi:hypothetical protein